jgi:hypothetical protein
MKKYIPFFYTKIRSFSVLFSLAAKLRVFWESIEGMKRGDHNLREIEEGAKSSRRKEN